MIGERQSAVININSSSGAAVTATQNSASMNVGGYTEGVLTLNTTAVSGTTPTLDVKVQTSPNGSDWYDMGSSITQVTGVARSTALKLTNLGQFIRVVQTIGGTTPSFTYDLNLTIKS